MLIDTLNKKITQFIEDGISKLDVKDEEVLELVNTDFLYTLNTPDIHLATNNF